MLPLCSLSLTDEDGVALARKIGEEAAVASGLEDSATPARVGAAVGEMVANGVRHAGGCVLTAWLAKDGSTLHFEIEDDGPGIEDLAGVADDRTPSEAGRGLAGTRALVDNLIIETERGNGTRVGISMDLPRPPTLPFDEIRHRVRNAAPEDPVAALQAQNHTLLRALGELQQERELRETQQRLVELMLRRSDLAVWEYKDGRREPVAESVVPSQLVMAALDVRENIHPDDRDEVVAEYERFAEGANGIKVEYRLRVGASYRWVFEQAHRFRLRGVRRQERVLGTTLDIDESETARRDAERLALVRERMVSIVGHDLRGPLGAVQLGLGTLKLVAQDPQVLDLLAPMERSLSRANGIISDLLDYVRGRAARGMPLNTTLGDLGAVVREQVQEARLAWPDVRFVVEDECPPDTDRRCHIDPDRIAQAVGNLLRNAAVHGEGVVKVRLGARSVDVSNGGEPIPTDVRARLFEPFHGSGGEGLGLGLWIARLVVRAHGSDIAFVSDEEQTSFSFSLPETGAAQGDCSSLEAVPMLDGSEEGGALPEPEERQHVGGTGDAAA